MKAKKKATTKKNSTAIKKEEVLLQPIVTEKTVSQKNKFTFLVHQKATKNDVKKAVNEFYGLEPDAVHIVRLPAKYRVVSRGHNARKRAPAKKAIISFRSETSLDFNAFK